MAVEAKVLKGGKRYRALLEKVDTKKVYSVDEAFRLIPEIASARFDETVEVAVRLGVDPRKADQMVRGTVVLPHGTGKSVKVLVFARGEKAKEAEEAGADYVGAEDLVEKISSGWLEFDRAVATPDMMPLVGRLGRVLGPRGLMPNPKTGTVTQDVAKAIKEIKAGKIEYKVDKGGNVHAPIGKVSFGPEKLKENFLALMRSVIRAKPPSSKGTYLKAITVSTTMGPGIKIDPLEVRNLV